MRDMFKNLPTLDHPMIQAVAKYVCGELNVPVGRLRGGDSLDRTVTTARHIIWYVLHDIGFYTYGEIGRLFIMDRTTVMSGVSTVQTIVTMPLAICGKGQLYTPERKKLVSRLAVNARTMALDILNKPVAALNRETVTIPVCRIALSEMDNLAMTDLATRFSGGWLVEIAEFTRDPSRYPPLLREPLEQEKESKFVWVITTSSVKPSENTTGAPSEGVTDTSLPITTVDRARVPSTLPETLQPPSAMRTSKLQMQSV